MTAGQELALEQLRAIQEADPLAFEVVSATPHRDGPDILVVASLSCRGIRRVPDGLPLRERERFQILISPSFPFSQPSIWTPHKRFAGRAHVFWGQFLCLYQASETEWDYSDGMFGLIQRLWVWLEHGARNEPEPEGMPIHPPFTLGGASSFKLVPRANAPAISGCPWLGFASLEPINEKAFALTSWQAASIDHDPTPPVAPSILLPQNLPWEMPTDMEGLCQEMQKAGVSVELVMAMLQWAIYVNPKGHPLFVVVGCPQRGVQATGQIRQHLMIWQVMDVALDALNISIDWARLKFQMNTLDLPEDHELRKKIQTGKASVDQLALDILKKAKVHWSSVLEDRPEVTIRRDHRSPMGIFRDRAVCLWGCGALGSPIAYLLVKAGVKKLVLLDKATVKPGLLVRQMFGESEVGESKTNALKRRLDALGRHIEIEAIPRDVLGELSAGTDWTRGADFVIDCTASDTVHAKTELAWARLDSRRVPLVSMIVGHRAERGIVAVSRPGHTGALKDVFRRAKLAACQKPSLSAFADDFYPQDSNIQFFQPEPGCSDATFEGSCADVTALSALMLNSAASVLQQDPGSPAAACFVCQPQLAAKGPSYEEFHFEPDISCRADYEIRISNSAWKEIAAVIREGRRKRGLKPEIGGLLFGKRDDALRIIWIDDAIGPPPDSICRPDKFICGIKGTQEAHSRRKQRSRGSTEFVGMWHTHPQDAPFPSETDLSGMAQLLTTGEKPPLRSLLLIVGWAGKEVVLGTSVFGRSTFAKGGGVILVTATHFPQLKT
jgi:integrative and conjugative element protein (TIGR02256 family)